MSVLGKLSDYEIARLKRIQEIQKAMEEFGVKQASEEVKEKKERHREFEASGRIGPRRRRSLK